MVLAVFCNSASAILHFQSYPCSNTATHSKSQDHLKPQKKRTKHPQTQSLLFPSYSDVLPFPHHYPPLSPMETIFSPPSFSLINHRSPFSKSILSASSQSKCPSLSLSKTPITNLKKTVYVPASLRSNKSWLSHVHHGLAALALSLAINFCPVSPSESAWASEFDVLNEGPPAESYVVDDAGVLSRVTKSDLKRLLSDLESRKNLRINFVTVRKLTSKADAFEYADQVLEKWYPTVEEGSNKGIVVLVTSQKEGAITGGPGFIQAVGDNILDATVTENLPVLATDEKYNEAVISSARRLVAAIDGLPDTGGPTFKENKRESNFKSKEETEEKRGQFTLVVGGLLVIAFVVPMAQYYAYVSKK